MPDGGTGPDTGAGVGVTSDGGSGDESADADAGEADVVVPTLANPTPRTKALFALLLQQVSKPGAFFGQQHASWEGTSGRFASFQTDIHDALVARNVANARHPAVYGWNYQTYATGTADTRAMFRQRMIDTDARGGINTVGTAPDSPARRSRTSSSVAAATSMPAHLRRCLRDRDEVCRLQR